MTPTQAQLVFDQGWLKLLNVESGALNASTFPFLQTKKGVYGCEAVYYRELVLGLKEQNILFADQAQQYKRLRLQFKKTPTPFEHQTASLESWLKSKWGMVVLPTGAGKTFLAILAMQKIQRSTLVLVPTLDLLHQWHQQLEDWFVEPIGQIGGGQFELLNISVSTYDSCRIHHKDWGHQFGLLVFDECHHFTAKAYWAMSQKFIAPYRLGLTATPPTEADLAEVLTQVVGEKVYQLLVEDLSGTVLANYHLETVLVDLNDTEREAYEIHRHHYLSFWRQLKARLYLKNWQQFVFYASQSKTGRQALHHYAQQRQLAIAAEQKLAVLAQILVKHCQERILIFTHDNWTAYKISRLFFLPLITHETKLKERKEILAHFRSGHWPILVSSRVLNEGVDVPEASIAVIISGSSTVREHLQRLGRILRKKGQTAILYEIVANDTHEVTTSLKRQTGLR